MTRHLTLAEAAAEPYARRPPAFDPVTPASDRHEAIVAQAKDLAVEVGRWFVAVLHQDPEWEPSELEGFYGLKYGAEIYNVLDEYYDENPAFESLIDDVEHLEEAVAHYADHWIYCEGKKRRPLRSRRA